MTNALQQLAEQYAAALRNHVSTPDNEEMLFQAYEIGRTAINGGAGVLDMVRLHHQALRDIIKEGRITEPKSIDMAAAFFAEALSSYEMLLRGYRESNAALVETNEMLRRAKLATETANRELERLATTDPLTGVSNRRHFHAIAALEIMQAVSSGHPLTALVLDVDHFKSINDTHGHTSGDEALRRLADATRAELRTTDLLARMGGDEFAALLPNTDVLGALHVGERLRARIAETTIEFEGHTIVFTISIGVAGFSLDDDTIDKTLAKADLALYSAKAGGRNRLSLAPQSAAAPARGTAD
jgi:diguanylate cyclase (GGDEF)-like protein